MKAVITFVLISICSSSFAGCELTPEQRSVMLFAYSYGEPHDYGYAMVAIAMEESDLGRWNINLYDPSAGPWHVTIDKAIDKLGWDHTKYNYNRAAQMLADDIYLSAAIALETLLWWDKVRDGNWREVVSSYNGGWKGNDEYLNRIIANIKTIKECNWIKE